MLKATPFWDDGENMLQPAAPTGEEEGTSLQREGSSWTDPTGTRGKDRLKSETLDFFVNTFCRETPVNLKNLILNLEKAVILKALSETSGNQKEAAKLLGINYTTLNEKVKRHKIRIVRRSFDTIS